MSWYELIELDKVRSLRQGSSWATDPIRIKIREEAANFMAEFANTKHVDLDAPVYSDGEETEEEESDDASFEEYAESEGESGDSAKSTKVPASDSAKSIDQALAKTTKEPTSDSAKTDDQTLIATTETPVSGSADPDASESAKPSSPPPNVIPASSESIPATESAAPEAPVS